MLYKEFAIEIAETRRMSRLDIHNFCLTITCSIDEVRKHKWIAKIERLHTFNGVKVIGGSTPAIVWDLSRFYIDLMLVNRERCLKKILDKPSKNT